MTTAAQFKRSVSRFGDFAGDLIRSDHAGFNQNLSLFLDFFESDLVFRSIHEQLLAVPGVNFDAWWTENSSGFRGTPLKFPLRATERMALMYELLRRIGSDEIKILNLVLEHYPQASRNVTVHIQAFNNDVTRKFVRDISYRIEDVADQLPRDDQLPIPSNFIQIIHSAGNVIQQHASGNNITQTAHNQNGSEIERLFDRLEATLRAQNASNEALQEHLEILASARQSATSSKPQRSVVKALLSTLPVVGDVASITSSIVSLLSSV